MTDKTLIYKDYEKIIKGRYKDLTNSEKRLADCVLTSPNKIKEYTITEFSSKCGVSEATATRFIQNCGFENYRRFRMIVSQQLSSDNQKEVNMMSREKLTTDDSMSDIIMKFHQRMEYGWSIAASNVNAKEMQKAIDLLLDSDRIFVFGGGGSAYIASTVVLKLMKLGLNAVSYLEHNTLQTASIMLGENDTALVISHEGNNSKTLDILTLAKSSGCKAISCTSSSKSLIAKASDINIVYGDVNFYFEKTRGEIGVARAVQVAIIELLMTALSLRLDES